MTFAAPYEPLIHAALLERVKQVRFPLVRYESGDQRVQEDCYSQEIGARTSPAASSFDLPVLRRLDRRRERDEWIWVLELKFNSRVNVEAFEASVSEDPPIIPRDATHDLQVELQIESVSYEYPPQGNPANGMVATFRFDAVKSPE